MNATTHSIPAALLLNVTPFEAEVLARFVETFDQ